MAKYIYLSDKWTSHSVRSAESQPAPSVAENPTGHSTLMRSGWVLQQQDAYQNGTRILAWYLMLPLARSAAKPRTASSFRELEMAARLTVMEVSLRLGWEGREMAVLARIVEP
ncbi:hypothetical protein AAC387_Pa10g1293 [Persea americana]